MLPLDACIQKIGLTKVHFLTQTHQEGVLPAGPTFGQTDNREYPSGGDRLVPTGLTP
jgi:hypothetical protein